MRKFPKCGYCKLIIDPRLEGRAGMCSYYKNKYYHLDCTPDAAYGPVKKKPGDIHIKTRDGRELFLPEEFLAALRSQEDNDANK